MNLTTVQNSPNYAVMNDRLEGSYHNAAHSHISGWLGDITSPKDPLFFLLHCNVDRAWLLWQKDKSAFSQNDATHYSPQGGYAPGGFHQGSFANDTQWPWDLSGGNQGTTDPGDDWPEIEFPLRPPFANHGPSAIPTTKQTVDFMNMLGAGSPHNYSYDSISYRK